MKEHVGHRGRNGDVTGSFRMQRRIGLEGSFLYSKPVED